MKRWTTILLTMAMLLTLLPASAVADERPSTDTYCSANSSGQHSWRGWTTDYSATCTKDGARSRVCGRCGYRQTEAIKKTGHSWGKWKTTKEATCAKPGEQTRTCSMCDKKDTRQTDRLPHTWGEWTVVVEPTDFSKGTRSHTCQVCGAEQTEEFYPDPTYKRGDRGDGVKALQEGLNAAGYDCGTADGDFGRKTESAVKAIEAAHGVEADGIAWPGVQKWLTSPAQMISTYSNGDDASDLLDQFRNTGVSLQNLPEPLVILTQPVGGDIDPDSGESLILSVEAAGGSEPYSYRWYRHVGWNDKENRPMGMYAGSEEKELPVNAPGGYYCRVTDATETRVYSEIAVVTGSLTIIDQPQNANLYGKESVMLFCFAAGGVPFDNGDYIYAWYNGAGEQVSFSDDTALKVTEPGEYYCVVEDSLLGSVTSQTATVYDVKPLQCTWYSNPDPLLTIEDVEIYARFKDGVTPYTAEWTRDGETVPTSNVVDGITDVEYYAAPDTFGTYLCTVTDAMGETATAEVAVEYAQLAIAEQPKGGMLAKDFKPPVVLKVVMAEGQKPFKYFLFENGKQTLWFEEDEMEGSFGAWAPGEYYIHIEDAEGRWANTEKVLVQDYEFHIDTLTVSGPFSGPEEVQTLTAEVVGGVAPITYRWWRKGGSSGDEYTDTMEPSHDIRLPGEYYCEAEDKYGTIAISPSVKVEYVGETPIITLQPKNVILPHSDGGGYSAELSCWAVTGSPTTGTHAPIMYTWERKGESGWIYNREQGPTIHVTEPGIYHCICRDTYSGQATISQEAFVSSKMSCHILLLTDHMNFEVSGGIPPYDVDVHVRVPVGVDDSGSLIYEDSIHSNVTLMTGTEYSNSAYPIGETYTYVYDKRYTNKEPLKRRIYYYLFITDAGGQIFESERQ